MRRNGYSSAYRDFTASLRRAEILQRIEKKLYSDPPLPAEITAVEALRGGAAVLIVASLESYLRDAMAEYIDLIASKAVTTAHPNLPSHFAIISDWNYVSWLARDTRLDKASRLLELKRAASAISSSQFIAESFNRTRSNPGPDTIKTLLKELGISDPLAAIEMQLPRHYAPPFARGFVKNMLDTIISRRNNVAHGGSSLSISRVDLQSSIAFMNAFARSTDNVVRDHCLTVIAAL